MLHLIPAPLHRQLYRLADRTRRLWWRAHRKPRTGVVVVAFDADGRVLLVRHSYGPRLWTLPGGGIRRGEQPEQAMLREIREELGCSLGDLVAVDAGEFDGAGSLDQQQVFAGRLVGEPVPDMREIVAVTLVDPAALPERCGRLTRGRIAGAVADRRALAERSQQR